MREQLREIVEELYDPSPVAHLGSKELKNPAEQLSLF